MCHLQVTVKRDKTAEKKRGKAGAFRQAWCLVQFPVVWSTMDTRRALGDFAEAD